MTGRILLRNCKIEDKSLLEGLILKITGKSNLECSHMINLSSKSIQAEDLGITAGNLTKPSPQHKVAARTKQDVSL